MLRRAPEDLPLFGAFALGLSLLAFGYTALYVELWIGRPSSTSSLAFIFVPVWGGLAALVGWFLGFVARTVWRQVRRPAGLEKPTWSLVVTLGCAVVVAAGAGAFGVIRSEDQARPRVRADSGLLVRQFSADSQASVRASKTLYELDRQPEGVSWGGNKSEALIEGHRILLRDTLGPKRVEVSTGALDYITRVDAVPMFRAPGAAPLLALVISGRATGRRAIVVVIDQHYKVVFEEQLERFWELKQTSLEIRALAGHEYIVVGPGCERSLILRPKEERSAS